jgi:hypothetical protein
LAAGYVAMLPTLARVAKEHGYALGVHGSMNRDCDLIAAPWTEEATDALTLIKALKRATDAVTHGTEWDDLVPDCSPSQKPHGRLAYSLHLTEKGMHGPYLDISIMPRIPARE